MSTIEKAIGKLKSQTLAKDYDEQKDCSVNHLSNDVAQTQNEANDFLKEEEDLLENNKQLYRTDGQRDAHQKISIPLSELEQAGQVSPNAPRSQIAEEYRVIKRPLLMNILGKGAASVEHPNLIMVTSCLQGEGKTFSSINLAMSMSMEKDKSVLFVDGDVAKATGGKKLGVPEGIPGLIDILEHDHISVDDVILHTNIPNFRIIPSGNIHERSTELLASQKMQYIANELSERYQDRIIIFDSPPLLLTTEARVLANSMGQIVFVVAAEQTSNDALKEAIGYISDDKVIGMVLNKAKRNLWWDKQRYGYSYGYGYGYGGRASSLSEDN